MTNLDRHSRKPAIRIVVQEYNPATQTYRALKTFKVLPGGYSSKRSLLQNIQTVIRVEDGKVQAGE